MAVNSQGKAFDDELSDPPITDLRVPQYAAVNNQMALMLQTSSWGQLAVEMMERVPELQWPQSNVTFHAMRNDSQVDGLVSGIVLPALRMRWSINPNGAPDEVVQKISRDYNLPIQGEEYQEDDTEGFDFADHLYHATLALVYGHMMFDEWGSVGPDGLWHITEMDPIMPQTITEINVDPRGKLESIRQMGSYTANIPSITGDRLVPYVWQKEGSNWTGRSMLRPLYRDWLIKDRILRVNAINIERAGAGVPTIEAPPGATPAQIASLDALAQAYKVGEEAGGALPNGAKLRLMGVEGQQPDAIKSVNYHDESMARSFLAMLIQLGQTKTGSRALGSTFSDLMAVVLEAVAGWASNRFNKTVIKRDIGWNYPEGTRKPKLVHESFDDPNLAVADFVNLIDKGAIVVDPELREWVRQKYRLPPEMPEANATGGDSPPPVPDTTNVVPVAGV